jgi:acetolactate synthase I/III small subunit
MISMSISKKNNAVGIGLLVQDHPGVMMKITAMFARRGYNIESITVGHSEREGLSRVTIMAEGDMITIEQIMKQLNKLVDVIKVQQLDPDNSNMRELALIKVLVKDNYQRQEVITLVDIFRGNVVDVTSSTMTVEIVGSKKKIDSFIDLVTDSVSVRELTRSGTVALLTGEDTITL